MPPDSSGIAELMLRCLKQSLPIVAT